MILLSNCLLLVLASSWDGSNVSARFDIFALCFCDTCIFSSTDCIWAASRYCRNILYFAVSTLRMIYFTTGETMFILQLTAYSSTTVIVLEVQKFT